MPAIDDDTARPGLRARVMRGLAWAAMSQVVAQICRMVVALVLARLLAPHDYGLAAMVLVFSSLVLVFSDLGLGAALVQRKELTEDDKSTAFWTTVAAGAVFTAAAAALAGPLAGFYGQPDIADLAAGFSIVFFITSIGATQEALLVRAMSFRALEGRLMTSTTAGAIAGIVVALRGGGAWAIIAQQLAEATTSTVLLWLSSPWRPSLRFSRASLRELWGFSGWLVGHRLLFYVHRNADNILVGRFIGAAALGAYTLAYNTMLVPFSRLAGPVQRVLWPAFAEMQDDAQRIAANWVRVTRLLAVVTMPALAGLVVVAPDFVAVILGNQWAAAVPLVQVLAWVGLLQAIQILDVDILQARGRTSTVFRFMAFFCVAHLCAFSIGLQWGVLGVAVAYAVSSTFVEPVLTWLTARELGVSPWRVPRALLGVVQASAVMAAAVLALRLGLERADVPAALRLILCVLAGAAVYAGACAWRVPELRAEIRGVLRRPVLPTAPIVRAEPT